MNTQPYTCMGECEAHAPGPLRWYRLTRPRPGTMVLWTVLCRAGWALALAWSTKANAELPKDQHWPLPKWETGEVYVPAEV